ncbi:DUF4349 domain-containing protein [Actinomadura formosensis]|uniref:DUF4349 domain-containing protein n=1 Tax=Actinomadura formosensis TaxID=60706 RepID=UPI003D910996
MRIVRNAICALVVLLLAGVLAACGAGSHSSGSPAAVDRGGAPAPAVASSRGGEGSAGKTANGAQAPPPSASAVIHTARLGVRAGDVEAAAAKAKQMVTAAGGYVERESSSSDPARSEIALKIPADRYADVLNRLGTQLGTRLWLSQEAEDVTAEVADVDARVRSAKATLESFRKLLNRANSVGEVIDIEREIAQREADLEALQARQKSLKHRTEYATVTVSLVSKSAQAGNDKPRGGFLGGLQSGWDAFTAFTGGVVTVLGWLLPFLVAAAAIGFPLLAFRHRLPGRSRRRPKAEPEPGPEPEPEKAVTGSQPPPA